MFSDRHLGKRDPEDLRPPWPARAAGPAPRRLARPGRCRGRPLTDPNGFHRCVCAMASRCFSLIGLNLRHEQFVGHPLLEVPDHAGFAPGDRDRKRLNLRPF